MPASEMNLIVPCLSATCLLALSLGVRGDEIVFTPEQLRLPGKRGACLTLRDPARSRVGTWDENLPRLAKLQPYWNYSWGANWVPLQAEYIDSEFIPMIWGSPGGRNPLEDKTQHLRRTVAERVVPRIKDGTVKRVMGFNEPDKQNQANMPYREAVDLWPVFMELGVPLVSPACANPEGIDDDSAQGVPGTWMRDFMREVDQRGYRVDYIGVHWYGGTNVEAFQAKMRRIYEKYGRRPLLITEFAPADWQTRGDPTRNRHSPSAVLAFAKRVLPWMEEQDWIAGYAWFSFGIHQPQGYTSTLFHADGSLTALGRYYASVTSENPSGEQGIPPDDADELRAQAMAAAKQRADGLR